MEQLKEKGSLVSDGPRLGDQTLLVTSDCEDFPRGYRKVLVTAVTDINVT